MLSVRVTVLGHVNREVKSVEMGRRVEILVLVFCTCRKSTLFDLTLQTIHSKVVPMVSCGVYAQLCLSFRASMYGGMRRGG